MSGPGTSSCSGGLQPHLGVQIWEPVVATSVLVHRPYWHKCRKAIVSDYTVRLFVLSILSLAKSYRHGAAKVSIEGA